MRQIMFEFLRKNSGSGTGSATPATPGIATAANTQIQYNPGLIQQLKADHRKLLDIYGGIKPAFDVGDYVRVSQRLDEFRRGLQGHQ